MSEPKKIKSLPPLAVLHGCQETRSGYDPSSRATGLAIGQGCQQGCQRRRKGEAASASSSRFASQQGCQQGCQETRSGYAPSSRGTGLAIGQGCQETRSGYAPSSRATGRAVHLLSRLSSTAGPQKGRSHFATGLAVHLLSRLSSTAWPWFRKLTQRYAFPLLEIHKLHRG